MELHEAEKLALELMAQFGLRFPAWQFEFDDARRRFGSCRRWGLWLDDAVLGKTDGGGKITLSRELTLRNGREQVEDTVRHEIAHALCPPKAGHGSKWKAMCARTGANPERCYDSEEVDAPRGDWSATCGVCKKTHYRLRKPTRDMWCADKECKRMPVPYTPDMLGDSPVRAFGQMSRGFHPLRKLVWRHKDAIEPSAEARRAAVESMKARLRAAERTEAS